MIRVSRITTWRSLSLLLFGLLSAALICSTFVLPRRGAAAQQRSANCPACKQVEDHYVNIPYFAESGGMTSTLSLNNNLKEATEVKITVFNGKGESFQPPPVTLPGEQITRLSLKDLTKEARGDFNSGNIQIFYRGPAMGVTSQVSVASIRQRLSFESMAAESMMFASNKLNGIVWIPDDHTQASVALTNVAATVLTVTATSGLDSNKKVKAIKLEPRETFVLDLKEFVDGRRAATRAALVKLEHSGAPGDLIATGFALNEKTGFSSSLNFVDPGTIKSTRLAGAHLRFGKAHEREGFPSSTIFRAPLVIANVGDAPTEARISVDYTIEATANRVELEPITLAAQEVKELDLTQEMARRGVSGPVENAGVDINYNSAAGSVIGRLVSFDASGDFGFEVPIKDPLSGVNRVGGSYPWRLDQGYTSVLQLKNTIGETVYALVQLRYAGGTYHLERLKLAPYQTVAVDIKQLRDSQQKDIRGGVMPPDLTSGKVVWYEEKVGSLIGRAEVAKLDAGMASSFSCGGSCPCSPNYDYSYFAPYSLAGPAGQYGNFTLYEMRRDPCDNTYGPYNRTSDASWSSSSPSVASIQGPGSIYCATVGTCTITAQFTAVYYEAQELCYEYPSTVSPTGQVTVAPQVTIGNLAAVGKNFTANVEVTLSPSPSSTSVTLTLSTTSGTGSAKFSDDTTSKTISQTTTVTIKGVTESSTANNIRLEAKSGSTSLATRNFTVVEVTFLLRTSGNVSNDNAGLATYQAALGTTTLGTFYSTGQSTNAWRTGVEVVGTVKPNNFTLAVQLRRERIASNYYKDSTPDLTEGTAPDDSLPEYRDDDPQSGGSGGKVYDLDGPSLSFSSPVGTIFRRRSNFRQWAEINGVRVSADLNWFCRLSVIRVTTTLYQLRNDINGDNIAGTGTTNLTWNLQ